MGNHRRFKPINSILIIKWLYSGASSILLRKGSQWLPSLYSLRDGKVSLRVSDSLLALLASLGLPACLYGKCRWVLGRTTQQGQHGVSPPPLTDSWEKPDKHHFFFFLG